MSTLKVSEISELDDAYLISVSNIVNRVSVPSTATSVGIIGQFAINATHVYFCVATNTWVRSPVATW